MLVYAATAIALQVRPSLQQHQVCYGLVLAMWLPSSCAGHVRTSLNRHKISSVSCTARSQHVLMHKLKACPRLFHILARQVLGFAVDDSYAIRVSVHC
jgi:hypothetical protein